MSAAACSACGAVLPGSPTLEGADRRGVAEGRFEVFVCGSCGSGNTGPFVEESGLVPFYDSLYGPHDGSGATVLFAKMVSALRTRTKLFRTITKQEPGAVLDVGSGRGDLLASLKDRDWKVTGIETVVGTLATGIEGDGLFDAVTFHHSLGHVVEPHEDLRRARALLKPGGRVLVAVPNFGSRASKRMGETWWALDTPRHRTHFTKAGIQAAMIGAGLSPTWIAERASVLGTAANFQQKRSGAFTPSGVGFLVGYAIAAAVYPLFWVRNQVSGGGEALAAVGISRPESNPTVTVTATDGVTNG